jgi:hypothetical protein
VFDRLLLFRHRNGLRFDRCDRFGCDWRGRLRNRFDDGFRRHGFGLSLFNDEWGRRRLIYFGRHFRLCLRSRKHDQRDWLVLDLITWTRGVGDDRDQYEGVKRNSGSPCEMGGFSTLRGEERLGTASYRGLLLKLQNGRECRCKSCSHCNTSSKSRRLLIIAD